MSGNCLKHKHQYLGETCLYCDLNREHLKESYQNMDAQIAASQQSDFCPHGVNFMFNCLDCAAVVDDFSDFCPHGMQKKFDCVQCDDERQAQSKGLSCKHGKLYGKDCVQCADEKAAKPFVKDSQVIPKTMVSLIPVDFILGLSDVLSYGANRYGRDNWKTCPQEDLYLYKDAMLRHIYSWLGGELVDKDTGLSHLHHAAVNMAFLLDFENEK